MIHHPAYILERSIIEIANYQQSAKVLHLIFTNIQHHPTTSQPDKNTQTLPDRPYSRSPSIGLQEGENAKAIPSSRPTNFCSK